MVAWVMILSYQFCLCCSCTLHSHIRIIILHVVGIVESRTEEDHGRRLTRGTRRLQPRREERRCELVASFPRTPIISYPPSLTLS